MMIGRRIISAWAALIGGAPAWMGQVRCRPATGAVAFIDRSKARSE
jgi:hypothetical protein